MTYQSLSEQATLGGICIVFAIEYYRELDLLLRDYWEEGTETVLREGEIEVEPVLEEVGAMLSWRTGVLTPYLHGLGDKQDTGHNCSLCSGRCDMQHSMRMRELEESHDRLSAMLEGLPFSALAFLSTDTDTTLSTVRALRILSTAAEMIHAERAYLIPTIHQARKDIYADAAREGA